MAFFISESALHSSASKSRMSAPAQPTPLASSLGTGNDTDLGTLSCVPAPADRIQPCRVIPLTDWPKYHAWPPIGGLRHLVFFEHTNGFHQVVRRVGRRVLIDEAAFFAWVESTGGSK